VRDAGRTGFRRSVVGAIFFVSQSNSSAFFEDRLVNLFEGEAQAKRALSGLP
jgi:hypothetical protein